VGNIRYARAWAAVTAVLSGCGGGGSTSPSSVPVRLAAVCHATSSATLVACANSANNGNALDEISIDAPIVCGGPDACSVAIYRVTRPLLIEGNGNTISRQDSYDYTILAISESQNITVTNLTIQDPVAQADYTNPTSTQTASNPACQPAGSALNCLPDVYVGQSDNVTLDHLIIEHAKAEALSIDSGSNLTVSNCTFRDAFFSGLSTGAGAAQVTITDNLFEDIRSNALVVSGTQVTVSSNTFHHDHHAAAWWNDPTTRLPSSGGMLAIYNHIHHLVIENNELLGSQIDEQIDAQDLAEFGLQAHGIEIDYAGDFGQTTDMSDIQITDNRIHDLSGVAITLPMEYVQDPTVNIQISGNTFYNDSIDLTSGAPIHAEVRTADYSGPVSYPFADNCYAQVCPSPQPPVPGPPVAPMILTTGPALDCSGGYGVSLTGDFRQVDYLSVLDAATNTPLHSYQGVSGPYQIDHRTDTLNSDGTRTFKLCFATDAEKSAFDAAGVRIFVTDPVAIRAADVSIQRM
jgi:Right handed beta helix region